MRSTRGRTRASRANTFERHHYTDRGQTVPVQSNSPVPSRKRDTPARIGWERGGNTNLQLSRGGMSCFPRMREGFAGSRSMTERA